LNLSEGVFAYLFESIIFYSPIVSFTYYFLSDLLLLLEKFLLEQAKGNQLQIKNFKILKDLTNISHIFLSKNSLIEPQNVKIHSLVLVDKYIELTEEELTKMNTYFTEKKNNILSGSVLKFS